ncbi:MAG: hypothetical protein ACK5Q5_19675 [Planctomycetaceae bacterium]
MTRSLMLLTIAALSCGCTQLSLFAWGAAGRLVEAGPRNPVAEVVCLWEPAEGNDPNGLPCRGFAGQVLFFTPGSPQAAKVEGDICIYVFDDHGSESERSKPLQQFTFDAGSWNALMRPSDLGASYQLFVPYTRPGQWQADCSLSVRYTPAGGGSPVYSKMGPVSLPGRTRQSVAKSALPEGYSVPLPAGAPARTESAPGFGQQPPVAAPSMAFDLPNPAKQQMQQRLNDLQSAAARAARETGGPMAFEQPVFSPSVEASGRTDSPARRSYRLSPE